MTPSRLLTLLKTAYSLLLPAGIDLRADMPAQVSRPSIVVVDRARLPKLKPLDGVMYAVTGVLEDPLLLAEAKEEGRRLGMLCTTIPLGEGVLLCTRSTLDQPSLEALTATYLQSRIHGPEPVSFNTGALLYVVTRPLALAEPPGCTIAEVGTGYGFSTLWLLAATRGTRCRVATIDNRCERIEFLAALAEKLGVEDNLDLYCGDAREPWLEADQVHMLFIDGAKEQYHTYLEALERRLAKGALVLAHNTVSHPHLMKPFLEKLAEHTESVTLMTDPGGVTLAVWEQPGS